MRILEINKFYFTKGGADKHLLDLVELLKLKGYEVAVFSMRHPKNLPSHWEKYFVSTVGYTSEYTIWQKIKGIFRMFYSFEARKKINKLLDDFRPHIVHIHNVYHQLSPVILFEIKKRKIPIVMTVHDYKLINPNYNLYLRGEVYERCRDEKYYQCFLDKCVRSSYLKSFIAMLEAYWHGKILKTYEKNIDLYVAPSNFAKNILTEWGIDAKKIIVLPHFAGQEFYNTALQYTASNNNGSLEEGNYALYFGRISEEKGVDKLISIFKNLRGIKLYLAGSIENGLRIDNLDNVRYLGFLNQEELKKYIENARFVISGSQLPETFGLIALEANFCGKPFVGFRSGAYPEIIESGENGYLAENNSEFKNIIKKFAEGKINFDADKIQKESWKKYNSEKYYREFMEATKSLLTKKS